ncbi:25994_t:CDS:2, partial [Gigaspora margarita]
MSQQKTNYTYRIISLGFYPLNATKTRRNSINGTVYQIPDNYSFLVTIYKIQIIYKTQYLNNLVKYTINWINHDSEIQQCTSYNSATDVSNKFLQLFTFDLECLEKRRNSQKELSSSQINRRLRSLANDIKDNVQSLFLKHNMTFLEIEKVDLWHKNNAIEFNFQSLANNFTKDQYLDSIVYACDDTLVSRDSIRQLAAVISRID